MEKKKLLESVKSKPKDRAVLSAVFLKERGSNASAALFEVHNGFLLFYTVRLILLRPRNLSNYTKR